MRATQKYAKLSAYRPYLMSAVIIKAGKVISRALNRKSPGVLKDPRYKYKSIHAELAAILGVYKDDLKGATIFVAGESASGNNICSKPCDRCMDVIQEVGIKRVFYLEKDGSINWVKLS